MRIGDLSRRDLLSRNGFDLGLGPFTARVRLRDASLAKAIKQTYREFAATTDASIPDFVLTIEPPSIWRRHVRRQLTARFDLPGPFLPVPAGTGLPLLESALNWGIYSFGHAYLILHAAIVAKGDQAVVLPAPSGAGKSTLCAALSLSGWRLLSDEMTILDTGSGNALPCPRPVSLKNDGIDVIRSRFDAAEIGPEFPETAKGTIAYLQQPPSALNQVDRPARPRLVIAPTWRKGAPVTLEPIARAKAFLWLAGNSVNYLRHGRAGFDCIADLVEACDFYHLTYGDLDDAVAAIDQLTAGWEL